MTSVKVDSELDQNYDNLFLQDFAALNAFLLNYIL
jgi:hypothetical protein